MPDAFEAVSIQSSRCSEPTVALSAPTTIPAGPTPPYDSKCRRMDLTWSVSAIISAAAVPISYTASNSSL